MEMASLGKAVTGICVAEVVREGLLGYDDVFSDIVGKGPDLSVAQLLNQTSGLRTDSTQKLMVKRFAKAGHRSADVVDAVIKRGAPKGAVGQFRYNNENYALLAPMIEEVTQTDFERACQARVFAPAGVLAQVSAVAASSLSWGGWAMSADDYAQFHSYWFGPDSAYGQDPFALPHAQLDGGVRYGHGMFIRASQDSYNFWHFGALCFPSGHNSGSYAVSWQGKWSAVAAYDVCPDWGRHEGFGRRARKGGVSMILRSLSLVGGLALGGRNVAIPRVLSTICPTVGGRGQCVVPKLLRILMPLPALKV